MSSVRGFLGLREQFLDTAFCGCQISQQQQPDCMTVLTHNNQFPGQSDRGGGGLDVDSVDGPGPEMFTMASPQRGAYHVYVNYWGKLGASGYHFDETKRKMQMITARLTLVFNENTAREKRETVVLPLRSIGDLLLVKSFIY